MCVTSKGLLGVKWKWCKLRIGFKIGGLSLVTCRNSASGDNQPMVTRFIAMGNYGNPDKANKGMYAFSIEPMVAMEKADLGKVPEDTTESPYSQFHSQTQVHHWTKTVHSHYAHTTLPLDMCDAACSNVEVLRYSPQFY